MRLPRGIAVRLLSAVTALAVGAGLTACSGAAATPPSLAGAQSFAFAIGNGMLRGSANTVGRRFAPYDLVVADGEEATPADIAQMHSHGTIVLGYLSVGTIEKWRSWYQQLAPYRLNADANWRDEWFADTSKRAYRRRIAKIANDLLSKGFDGLFLDNVDMVETNNHRAQRHGMKLVVDRLSSLAHSQDRLLFAQNGAWILRKLDMVGDLDGWNREDVTWTYSFGKHRYVRVGPGAHRAAMRELANMHDRGLFTTTADYTAHAKGPAVDHSVANSCSVGALPYVGNINLTVARLPDPPLTCP